MSFPRAEGLSETLVLMVGTLARLAGGFLALMPFRSLPGAARYG